MRCDFLSHGVVVGTTTGQPTDRPIVKDDGVPEITDLHHTIIGTAPEISPPARSPRSMGPDTGPGPEDLSRGHADFQRFLDYVRSLKR